MKDGKRLRFSRSKESTWTTSLMRQRTLSGSAFSQRESHRYFWQIVDRLGFKVVHWQISCLQNLALKLSFLSAMKRHSSTEATTMYMMMNMISKKEHQADLAY